MSKPILLYHIEDKMAIVAFNANINQFVNGDIFLDLYSSDPSFASTSASGIPSGGDFYLIGETLHQFTDYSMFDINDYPGPPIQTGLLVERDQVNQFSIRVALSTGTAQPIKFILRIFNTAGICKDSFIIQGGIGSTGYYYNNGSGPFFLLDDPILVPSLAPPEQSTTYRNLFYIFLIIVSILYIRSLHLRT